MDLTAWMEQWNMFPDAGGTILCAVSGGRDSVCLLHYLCSISGKYGFSVAAGHYNHHMRPTAQRDEDFVRALCNALQVPFYTDGCDVVAAAQACGCGVEETGRRLRYEFLERLADELGASRIATAHHVGDQAETVILNLLRGTGPEGLGGIPPVRGRLIRPLLNTDREEIEDYLAHHGIDHVEDETNESLAFSRNRLRRVVLPELEKINPALRHNASRTAAIVRRENEYLDRLARQHLPEEGTEVSCAALMEAPEALRPRMVRLLVDRLGTGKKDWGAVHVEMVLELAKKGRDGALSLPGGTAAVCRGGRLRLQAEQPAQDGPLALTEGLHRWNGWLAEVSVMDASVPCREEGLYLASDVPGVPELDIWRGGEGLELAGSRGKRSIKRLLTERGIPPEERKQIPCIRVNGTAAAVYGLGTDVQYLPKESGKKIEISLKKERKYRRNRNEEQYGTGYPESAVQRRGDQAARGGNGRGAV